MSALNTIEILVGTQLYALSKNYESQCDRINLSSARHVRSIVQEPLTCEHEKWSHMNQQDNSREPVGQRGCAGAYYHVQRLRHFRTTDDCTVFVALLHCLCLGLLPEHKAYQGDGQSVASALSSRLTVSFRVGERIS
eukprot:COSAG02_NODE_4265_length_5572_cov_3.251416_6_plen_137_part_00